MNIVDQIKQERVELLNQGMKPTSINLTVEQGFELLDTVKDGRREELQMILIRGDEEAMINFLNGSRFMNIPIFVRPLIISSRKL